MWGLREIIRLNDVAHRFGDRAALGMIRGGGGRALFNRGRQAAKELEAEAEAASVGGPRKLLEGGNDHAKTTDHEHE
jgi:hypothetical protein